MILLATMLILCGLDRIRAERREREARRLRRARHARWLS